MLQDKSAKLEVDLNILLAWHAQHLADTCIRNYDDGAFLMVLIIG
jgi:hypothetical protein